MDQSFVPATSDATFLTPRNPRDHDAVGVGQTRWGPCLFCFSQDHHQSHGFTSEEWRKIFLTVTSPSCSQLVSKCEDVLSAHAILSIHKRAHAHTGGERWHLSYVQHFSISQTQPWKPYLEVMKGFGMTFRVYLNYWIGCCMIAYIVEQSTQTDCHA